MRRWIVGGLTAVALVLTAHRAVATDFSADRIVKSGKAVTTAHVNAKGDRWRFEFTHPQGGASIIIVRTDRRLSWLILSERRQYLEVPIARHHLLSITEKMDGEVSREFIGTETFQGHPAELFEVTVSREGELRHYYQWVTQAQRFPVKTVSREGSWSEEFRHLLFVEQSPWLFELPQRLDRGNPPIERQESSGGEREDGARSDR